MGSCRIGDTWWQSKASWAKEEAGVLLGLCTPAHQRRPSPTVLATGDCELAWTTAHPQVGWLHSSLLGQKEVAKVRMGRSWS